MAGYGPPPAAPAANDSRAKNAKLARGCGGCGCALSLLAFIAGVVLVGFGTQPATTEAMPFGIIITGVALPIAAVGAALLFWGISALNKLKSGR